MKLADLGEPVATGRSARIYAWPQDDLVVKVFEADYDPALVDLERDSLAEAGRLGLQVCACHGEVDLDGHPGLLLERVDGESLTRQAERNPLRIKAGSRALARTHVQLHAKPTSQFTDVREATVAALDSAPMAFLDASERERARTLVEALPAGDRLLHMGAISSSSRSSWSGSLCGNAGFSATSPPISSTSTRSCCRIPTSSSARG